MSLVYAGSRRVGFGFSVPAGLVAGGSSAGDGVAKNEPRREYKNMNPQNSSSSFGWQLPMPCLSSDITFTTVNGPYGWLGNMAPFPIIYQEVYYRTAEALFQCLRYAAHPEVQQAIRDQKSPMGAKQVARDNRALLGRGDNWDVDESDVERMRLCLRLKLAQHPILGGLLERTGEAALIEDCSFRPVESACFCGAVRRMGRWHGRNMVGCLWMEMRAQQRTRGASPPPVTNSKQVGSGASILVLTSE